MGTRWPLNAISDERGVEVGETTPISSQGALKAGMGRVRRCGKNSRVPLREALKKYHRLDQPGAR